MARLRDTTGRFISAGSTALWSGALEANLAGLERKMKVAIISSGHQMAAEGEATLKANAPWTDRTGAARSGLTGELRQEGDGAEVLFFYQVPYGIWLEIANSGAYAVIRPNLNQFAKNWVTLLKAMWAK